MQIDKVNYYSLEAAMEYCGYSQFKDFCGNGKNTGCEAHALAVLKGEWKDEPTQALLEGQYVDAYFSGEFEQYVETHRDIIFNSRGSKYAHYIKADKAIERAERDKLFMQFLSGEPQRIFTAELFGMNWKIKTDFYHENKCIVDLKYIKDINETKFVKDIGHISWVEYYGYDIQGAIYQKVIELNTGKKLPYFICAIDKGEEPNIEIIQIPNNHLEYTLSLIEYQMKRYKEVKYGNAIPDRCEKCAYCKHTKILKHPIMLDELTGRI